MLVCHWSSNQPSIEQKGEKDSKLARNTGVLYAALAVISLFTFGLIFLKIDETVRFWALISFTGGFAMNMVKPGVENEHSTGWSWCVFFTRGPATTSCQPCLNEANFTCDELETAHMRVRVSCCISLLHQVASNSTTVELQRTSLDFYALLQILTLQAKNRLSEFLACSPAAHTGECGRNVKARRLAIEEVRSDNGTQDWRCLAET